MLLLPLVPATGEMGTPAPSDVASSDPLRPSGCDLLGVSAATGCHAWSNTFGFAGDISEPGARSDYPIETALAGNALVTTGVFEADADADIDHGVLFGADRATGEQLWHHELEPASGRNSGYWSAVHAPSTGDVIVSASGAIPSGDNAGLVRAVDPETGEFAWTVSFQGTHPYEPDGDYVGQIAEPISGPTAFVSGAVRNEGTSFDQLAAAVDVQTGDVVWERHVDYDGRSDGTSSLAAHPGAGLVVVAGTVDRGSLAGLTALDATTGETIWQRTMPGTVSHLPRGVAISDDGDRLFLTLAEAPSHQPGDATFALDTSDGGILWSAHAHGDDMALSPDGDTLVVTRTTPYNLFNPTSASVALTVAYDAETGEQLWRNKRTSHAAFIEEGVSVAFAPGTECLFVLGRTAGPGGWDLYLRVLDVDTGDAVWAARYNGDAGLPDQGRDIVFDPDAGDVYVNGRSETPSGGGDILLLKYPDPCGSDDLIP